MKDIFKVWIEFFEEVLSTKLARLVFKVLVIILFVCFIWPHAKSTYLYIKDRGSIEERILKIEKRLNFIENRVNNLSIGMDQKK